MLREDFIHISVCGGICKSSWMLLGGEPPGGSSDTLKRIYIRDPVVARDKSPDPRRHSKGAEKIDMIAQKGRELLLIEAKPTYSLSDQQKLLRIKYERNDDLFRALRERCNIGKNDIDKIQLALAFSGPSVRPPHQEFVHFIVSPDGSLELRLGESVSNFKV